MHALRAEIVYLAHGGAAFFGVVVNDIAHLCKGQNGDTNSKLIHLLNGLLRCPRTPASAPRASTSRKGTAAATTKSESRRLMMVMNVDVSAF